MPGDNRTWQQSETQEEGSASSSHAEQVDQLKQEVQTDVTNAAINVLDKELGESSADSALNVLWSAQQQDAPEQQREKKGQDGLSYLIEHGFADKTIADIETGKDEVAKVSLFWVYWSCVVDVIGGVCTANFPADRKTKWFTAEQIASVKTIFVQQKDRLRTPQGVQTLLPSPTPLQQQMLTFLTGNSVLAKDLIGKERNKMLAMIEKHGPTLMAQYTRDLHSPKPQGQEGESKLAQLFGSGNRKKTATTAALVVWWVAGVWALGKWLKSARWWLTWKKSEQQTGESQESMFTKWRKFLLKAWATTLGLRWAYELVKRYFPDLNLRWLFPKHEESSTTSPESPQAQMDQAKETLTADPLYAQKAQSIVDAVNGYFFKLHGDADVLGDGAAEHGQAGLSVALLASQWNVRQLLSVDGYQHLLEQASQWTLEKLRETMKWWGKDQLRALHAKLEDAAAQGGVWSKACARAVGLLINDQVPSGPDALTAAEQMKIHFRKQLSILTWLTEARGAYQAQSTPEELEAFLSMPLIGANWTPWATDLLQQKNCFAIEPSHDVQQEVTANNELNTEVQEDLKQLQQSPEQHREELAEMCKAHIEQVENDGRRTRASRWFSWFHEFFTLDEKERDTFFEASGYQEISKELTREAKAIAEKIARWEAVTAADYQTLADVHDRYTRFINKVRAQRLVVTEEMDDQGRKKLTFRDKAWYAGIVYKDDVINAVGEVWHGCMSIIMWENKREWAAQIVWGYVSLEWYTCLSKWALSAPGIRNVAWIKQLRWLLNKVSPTSFVFRKTFVELSKVTADAENQRLAKVWAKWLAVFRYAWPDGQTRLVRDYLLGRVDAKTASAIAQTKELGSATSIADLMTKVNMWIDRFQAEILAKYSDNPYIRSLLVTKKRIRTSLWRVRATVVLDSWSVAAETLEELKKLDVLIEKVPVRDGREALRGMMMTVKDLKKARQVIQKRNTLKKWFLKFPLASAWCSAEDRWKAFGRTINETPDLNKLPAAIELMNTSLARTFERIRSLKAIPAQILEQFTWPVILKMKEGMTGLLRYLKNSWLAKTPYAAKAQKMIAELELCIRLEGDHFVYQFQRFARNFPSVSVNLGRIAKYAGVWLGVVSGIVGVYAAVQARKEAEYFDKVNPEMAARTREFAGEQLWFAAVNTALVFIPGPGWVILWLETIATAGMRWSEALYDTERKYKQTTLQLMQEWKTIIIQELIHHSLWESGIDRGTKEKFARFWWWGVDFDFHAHASTQNALEAYFRLTFAEQDPSGYGWITTLDEATQKTYMAQYQLTPEIIANITARIDAKVKSAVWYLAQKVGTKTVTEDRLVREREEVRAPKWQRFWVSKKMQDVPKHVAWEEKTVVDIMPVIVQEVQTWDAFGKAHALFAEAVYAAGAGEADVVKTPQEVTQSIADRQQEAQSDDAYRKSLDVLYIHDRGTLALLSAQAAGFLQENAQYDQEAELLQRHAQQLLAYVNVKTLTEGWDAGQEMSRITYALDEQQMRTLLLNGKAQPVLTSEPLAEPGIADAQAREMLGISEFPVQDALYRIATEVLSYRIPHTLDALKWVFSEAKQQQHGLYISEDWTSVYVYNERDIKDMQVRIDAQGTQAHNDLVLLHDRVKQATQEADLIETWGTWEKELSRLYGVRYSRVLLDMITVTGTQNYPLKLLYVYSKEHRDQRFRLPVQDIGRCIQLGYRDIWLHQFKRASDGVVWMQRDGAQAAKLKDVIASQPSLQGWAGDYERLFEKEV